MGYRKMFITSQLFLGNLPKFASRFRCLKFGRLEERSFFEDGTLLQVLQFLQPLLRQADHTSPRAVVVEDGIFIFSHGQKKPCEPHPLRNRMNCFNFASRQKSSRNGRVIALTNQRSGLSYICDFCPHLMDMSCKTYPKKPTEFTHVATWTYWTYCGCTMLVDPCTSCLGQASAGFSGLQQQLPMMSKKIL